MPVVQMRPQTEFTRVQFEREMMAQSHSLVGLARMLTGNRERAEDLVQDTYTRALSRYEYYTLGTNMGAWLCVIMRNLFYSEWRRSWRMVPLDEEKAAQTLADPACSPEEQLGFAQDFLFFVPYVSLLPQHMSDSVIAAHYLGMSYSEIAFALNIEMGTVKSRVARGLDTLRKMVSSCKTYQPNVSSWRRASDAVQPGDPYYPIAKAYEALYKTLEGA